MHHLLNNRNIRWSDWSNYLEDDALGKVPCGFVTKSQWKRKNRNILHSVSSWKEIKN